MLRRNGKPRSCEPCRVSKIKCDHATPTCAKCQTRGITGRCFYHPNPMTRPAGTPRKKPESRKRKEHGRGPDPRWPQEQDRLASLTLSAPTLRNDVAAVPTANTWPSPPDSSTRTTPAGAHPARSFYLGSTSYASVFTEDRPLPDTVHEQQAERLSVIPSLSSLGTRHCHVSVAQSIVSRLSPFSFYKKAVGLHYSTHFASGVIGPLVTPILEPLSEDLARLALSGPDVYQELAEITKNTSKPLKPSLSMLPSEFHTLLTGKNLRWETLGLIIVVACCGLLPLSPDHDLFTLEDGTRAVKGEVFGNALQAANDCVTLCQIHGAVNDVMVWLLYCYMCVISDFYGDNYHATWRRLGDTITSLYATGMHCESENLHSEPLFLREARRRLYATVYWQDKTLATFFGRPPMLAWRYSDRRQLLDMSDEAITSDDPTIINEAISKIGPDGWNTEGKIHPASYLRLRCQHAVFKERLLEQSLAGEKDSDVVGNLQTISTELTNFWASVPPHMHYETYSEEELWKTIKPKVIFRLISAYLEYLHTHFQIQRMLHRQGQNALPALLQVSFRLTTASLTYMKPNSGAHEQRWQFPSIILFVCLPAAGVLALELRRCTLEGKPLPDTVSRADVIRNLSVLTSCLDWLVQPADGNYKLCSELNKMLVMVLDEVLNYQPPAAPSEQQQDVASSEGDPMVSGAGGSFFDLGMFEGLEPIPLGAEDFLDWLDNSTWNNNVNLI